MATNENTKRRAMDAIAHPETGAMRRLLGGTGRNAAVGRPVTASRPEPARGSVTQEVKRQLMDAVSNVQSVVAQVGAVKMTVGIAIYAAHIREQDHALRQRTAQRSVEKPQRQERLGRDYE